MSISSGKERHVPTLAREFGPPVRNWFPSGLTPRACVETESDSFRGAPSWFDSFV